MNRLLLCVWIYYVIYVCTKFFNFKCIYACTVCMYVLYLYMYVTFVCMSTVCVSSSELYVYIVFMCGWKCVLSTFWILLRGPHTFWLKKAERGEKIETNSDGLVNMLHYEDAAAATIAALLAGRQNLLWNSFVYTAWMHRLKNDILNSYPMLYFVLLIYFILQLLPILLPLTPLLLLLLLPATTTTTSTTTTTRWVGL